MIVNKRIFVEKEHWLGRSAWLVPCQRERKVNEIENEKPKCKVKSRPSIRLLRLADYKHGFFSFKSQQHLNWYSKIKIEEFQFLKFSFTHWHSRNGIQKLYSEIEIQNIILKMLQLGPAKIITCNQLKKSLAGSKMRKSFSRYLTIIKTSPPERSCKSLRITREQLQSRTLQKKETLLNSHHEFATTLQKNKN